jgi:hypothetical protein
MRNVFMRLYLIISLLAVNSFGQKSPLTQIEIETKINSIANQAIVSDSLEYNDSTCFYSRNNQSFSGYVLHRFNQELRYHLFETGNYYGEEWIFQTTSTNVDSLIYHLTEFRIRSDKHPNRTIVTNYYNFKAQEIHEIYEDDRFLCAKVNPTNGPTFDVIFGGSDDYRKYDYQSFYPNGQKKEVFKRKRKGYKMVKYHENGQLSSIFKIGKTDATAVIKEFDENGKCTMRMISRNGKPRGIYSIYKGEKRFSFLVRRDIKKIR